MRAVIVFFFLSHGRVTLIRIIVDQFGTVLHLQIIWVDSALGRFRHNLGRLRLCYYVGHFRLYVNCYVALFGYKSDKWLPVTMHSESL